MSRATDASNRLTKMFGKLIDERNKGSKALVMAYIKGIQMIYDYYDELLQELFSDTMCSFGLNSYVQLLGIDNSLPVEKKRQLINQRLGNTARVRAVGEMNDFLDSVIKECGFYCNNYEIRIAGYRRSKFDYFAKFGEFIEKYIPAGMAVRLNSNGLSANVWSYAKQTFYDLDSYNCPFSVYDTI